MQTCKHEWNEENVKKEENSNILISRNKHLHALKNCFKDDVILYGWMQRILSKSFFFN